MKKKVKVLESECNDQIQKLKEDFATMKLQLGDTKRELKITQHTLGWSETLLYPIVANGVAAMKSKLSIDMHKIIYRA